MASFLAYWSPRTKQSTPETGLTSSDSAATVSVKLNAVEEVDDPFLEIPEPVHEKACSQGEFNSNQRTRNQFRPRNAHKGTTSYQLRQYAEATLGGGSLRKVVKLPEGEDENEWLAVNSKESCGIQIGTNLQCSSGGFLQSYKSTLWINHRVLLSTILPGNEGHR